MSEPTRSPESLEDLLRRDLEAWLAAKAAVDKARRSAHEPPPRETE